MKKRILHFILYTLPFILSVAVVLILSFVLALGKLDDFDVWWHLKCGELFLRHGTILRQDIFSYTASGVPWVDGYLLAQAILYIAWWIGRGPAGVSLLGAFLVAATYALALVMSRRGNGAGFGLALAVLLPAVVLARDVMLPRPALFTHIFALVTLWLLENHRIHGGRRIWWLLPLTAVWANCHPVFILGPLFTAIYVVGAIHELPLHGRQMQRNILIPVLVGQILATLINPYGHRIYYSVFSLLGKPLLRREIIEWAPLFDKLKLLPGAIPCFIVVVAIAVAAFTWSGRHAMARLEHALIFLLVTVMTIAGRRNLLLFGSLSLPLISWTISGVGAQHAAPLRPWKYQTAISRLGSGLIAIAGLSMIWLTATDRLYFYTETLSSSSLGIQRAIFSEGAVELLKREPVQGRLFHSFDLGGYLIFRLYPRYRVFIDGRIYPYPLEVFLWSQKALASPEAFEQLRAHYDIRAVLLPLYTHNTWPLFVNLLKSPNWAVVYADISGALFLERGDGNDAIIGKYELNLRGDPPELPSPPAGRNFHFWDRAEYPDGIIWWAAIYEEIGRPDLAARVLKLALNYRPVMKNAEAQLGGLLIKSGQVEEAKGYLDRALERDPESSLALKGLVEYFIQTKRLDEAEKAELRLDKLETVPYNAWDRIGRIAYENQDHALAARCFQRAVNLKSDDGALWMRLGLSLETANVREAIAAYQRAIPLLRASGAKPEEIQRIQEHISKLGN